MPEPKNLSLEDAIAYLKSEYERMKDQPKEFQGKDPDETFLDGYKIAIYDLESATKPRP